MGNVHFVLLFVETFLLIFGLLGNLIALIVINRKCLRNTSSSVFITALAIFDSFVLISHGLNLIKISGHGIIQCILQHFTDLTTFCASWFLVIITIERFIAVYSPFLARRLCTVKSARYAVCIFILLSLIVFSIKFPIMYEQNKKLNGKCEIRENVRLIIRIYQPMLFFGVPDLFLLSNIFIVYSLCRRTHGLTYSSSNNDKGSEMRVNDMNSGRKQRQLTLMLLTVSLSFYVFTTPAMIFYIMEHRLPKHRDITKIKIRYLLSQMAVILLQLNNATNFIFYCFAGQRFRRETLETFYDCIGLWRVSYHRYILGDKHYSFMPASVYCSSQTGQTLYTTRSTAAQISRSQHRISVT